MGLFDSERFETWVPAAVSLMGGLGLGTALTYFIGVVLVFRPGWAQWAEFFNAWGPPLVLVPIVLLMGHLYGRMRVGEWLLERGTPSRAFDYATDRLKAGFLRGRREALTHRIVAARAQLCLGNYRACLDLLESGYAVPAEGRLAAAIRAWRMEAYLRLGDAGAAVRAFESIDTGEGRSRERARLWACRAEAAVLTGDAEAVRHGLESARWEEALEWRVDLVEAMARARRTLRTPSEEADLEQAARWLKRSAEPADREVPRRSMELVALRAYVTHLLGESSRSQTLLSESSDREGDERAQRVLRDIEEAID